MDLNNKNIIVTGGAGVIGTELVKKLMKFSNNITCIDRVKIPNDFPNVKNYIQKDLNDMDEKDIIGLEPEIIFHLAAAFERTEETAEFWEENYCDNIKASHFVTDIAKKCLLLKRFIFASSYLIYDPENYLYGIPQKTAIKLNETSNISTRNLCGAAKYYTEKELEFFKKYGEVNFTSVSVRIFRVYGKNSRDFLSRCVRSGLKGEKIILYRKEGMFDYIYSADVAEGLIRLAKSNFSGIINLGSGKAHSVETVINILKKEISNLTIEEKEIDIPYEASCADISKLEKYSNWKPIVSLEEGLKKIIEFEKNK